MVDSEPFLQIGLKVNFRIIIMLALPLLQIIQKKFRTNLKGNTVIVILKILAAKIISENGIYSNYIT